MRSASVLVLVIVAALLSGCAAEEGVSAARALTKPDASPLAREAVVCPEGSFLTGIDEQGAPSCSRPTAAFACPIGEFVNGFQYDGTPTCAPTTPPIAPCTPQRAETDSNLNIFNVFGSRPDSSSNIETITINAELAAGSVPFDLTKVTICYETFGKLTQYFWPSAGAPSFHVTWIRGSPSEVMLAGDLVTFEIDLDQPLGTRQDVALSIVPQNGASIDTDFRTPTTYGTDRVITLR